MTGTTPPRLAPGATDCEHGVVSAVEPVVDLRATDVSVAPARPRSGADALMRRLLRIDEHARRHTDDELRRGFSQSMLVSAVRCILTYLVLPFVAPLLGFAAGVGPVVGIVIGVVAITFNVRTIRRFWMADHRWRWAYTAVGGTVMAMLVVLIALDLAELLA